MFERFHRRGAPLCWPRTSHLGVWGVSLCVWLCARAPDALAQQAPGASHSLDTAWLPAASTWPQISATVHELLERPPLPSQDTSWEAARCTLDASGRLRTCEDLRRRRGDTTLFVARITWHEDGTFERASRLVLTHDALTLHANETTLHDDTTVYTSVRLRHEGTPLLLDVGSWLVTSTSHRFEKLTWRADSETPISATRAELAQTGGWRIDEPRYNAWVKRDAVTTVQPDALVRGLLPPRLLFAQGESLAGEEVVLTALAGRALFAGVFVAPQSSGFGVSLGVGRPLELTKHDTTRPEEVSPLRLHVGAERSELELSLHGDSMWTWSKTEHVDLHAEEGHEPWLTRSVLGEAGVLRDWRQSRAGVALGSEETVLQAAGVHDSTQGWWGAYLSAGGRYDMTRSGSFDFALKHRSTVQGEQDQIHRTEVTPGWAASWGRRDRLHGSLFAGLGIMQQSSESSERLGISTATRMAAVSMVQGGASFEGRGAHVTHHIDPRATLYVSPLSWSRRPTSPEDEDQTRSVQTISETQLGGVATLHQALVTRTRRAGVEVPVSLMGWRRLDDEHARATHTALMSDASLFYAGAHTRLDLGAWWCGANACEDGVLMGHVGLSRAGRWHIDYAWGAVDADQVTWRWLVHEHHTASAVNAGLWQDVSSARAQTDGPEATQAIRTGASLGAWQMSAMGFMGSGEHRAWGGMARTSHEVRRTGWHVDVLASVREGEDEARTVGVGVSWKE